MGLGSRVLASTQNDSGAPHDLRVLPLQPERAVSLHSGFRKGSGGLPMLDVKRREFITLLGGAAAAWPLAARAQQPADQMRRIGVLINLAADDPEGHARITAFAHGLQEAGWTTGRNVRIDYRWGGAGADAMAKYAAELVALAPDVILAAASVSVAALLQITRTIPIVFVQVIDPVSAGYVASLARPGGNATGFTIIEYGFSGKWLELLREIAPRITRAAVIRDPTVAAQNGQMGAIQSVAPSLGVELLPVEARDASEIERAVTAFARSGNGGLIVLSGNRSLANRELIITLAARERLPAIYADRVFVTGGGLISYDTNRTEQYRRAAGYVDRILKGEKPADLPVRHRPSTSWSSISRPPRRSASTFRRRCLPALTRSSNETAPIHHAARRRGGGLAARSARAAAGNASDRVSPP
jgi:putative tryptophan/tyrosine transport system substrate-binding protein